MNKELKFYRVLQHDIADQIKIGAAFPSNNIEQIAIETAEQYAKSFEWCGGFAAGCNKYLKRLAIVDAESLAVVRIVYLKL